MSEQVSVKITGVDKMARAIRAVLETVCVTVPASYKDEGYGQWTEARKRAQARALGLRPVVLIKSDRVRTVDMRGCMGTVRGATREGVVRQLQYRQANRQQDWRSWYVQILFDDGELSWYPASCTYWVYGDDGVAEYQH